MANEGRDFSPEDEIISEKGIYFYQLQGEDYPKIQTMSQLRSGVEHAVNYSRYIDLHSDSTGYRKIDDRSAFDKKYEQDIDVVQNGDLEDIKQLIIDYRLDIYNISPEYVNEKLFYDRNCSVHVDVDDLKIIPKHELGGIEVTNQRELDRLKPGMYVVQDGYSMDRMERRLDGAVNIKTLDDLKQEVKTFINDRREWDYDGWSPEEYSRNNVSEFNAKYDKEIDKVMNGGMADVLDTMKRYNIIISRDHPSRLTDQDFAIKYNPIFISKDELKLNGQNIEFSRAELPRNVERQLQVTLGTPLKVKEREQDRGHFAVVKDRFGEGYSMVRVDNKPEGHQLNVKRGFKSLEDTDKQIDNQLGRESLKPNKEMEKTPSMEVSR
ncbi:hypothetical protein [Priestia megaterium]|uniref:hypothetical protein n=1 Tax=Priestia megaterium TaxID=1404 RepID=UPI000BFCA121|nr:hypothetical protein [Priestia megaterium]PGQ88343.1 hypothetical protein COA18_05280 [Priestia megaterium]